jgi:hypothetical protein
MAVIKHSVPGILIIKLGSIFYATASCSEYQKPTDKFGCKLPSGYERVLISPDVPYQPWQVRASSNGMSWNGISTNEKELEVFAQQLAKRPMSAGSVVFEVNESSSCEQRLRVRLSLLRSGLCDKGRCWELEGIVQSPIVYSAGAVSDSGSEQPPEKFP